MSDEIADFDLSPKKVLQSLEDMSKEIKNLASRIEESLGKEAPKSIGKLEDAAENGTNKIQKFFRNLGDRVREDLKTAFDVGSLAGGLKMGSEFAAGTKQVFEMERAFDRLNTRLKLTGKQLMDFKRELGRKVAATGQKLEDVLPGVETVAARGGVKSPEQLEQIGDVLAKVKATTNEGTEGLSEKVVEILKNQGKKVTAQSFKDTVDALQGTRTAGAFKSAGDAGGAVDELAAYSKGKYSTRELGGLAAQASKAGPQGQDILRQLMDKGSTIGGQQQLNAILGPIFKNGKLDANALGRVDQKKFGQFSQQTLEHTTGLHGANGADLSRFLDSFKGGLDQMGRVVNGANETGAQFDIATDNLASKIDKFKERTKEAGREIVGSVSKLAGDVIGGHFGNLKEDTKGIGAAAWQNKGTLAGGLAVGGIAALLAGSGARKLLSKIPGGGMAGGLMGAEAAKAAGIQPVFVTNASEIGGGIGGKGIASGLLGAGKAGSLLQMLGGATAAAGVGVAIGEGILSLFPKVGTGGGDALFEAISGGGGAEKDAENAQYAKSAAGFNERNGTNLSAEEFAKAVETGTLRAHMAANKNKPTHYTNPSAVSGRGKGM